MIQRAQSIYLLIAGIASTLFMFIPFARFEVNGQGYFSLSSFGIDSINLAPVGSLEYWWLLPLWAVLVAVCSIGCIFLYKHRILQLRLVRLTVIFEVACCLTSVLQCYNFQSTTTSHFVFTIGTFLPTMVFIFLWLADHSIKKDEELVRAVNRIR